MINENQETHTTEHKPQPFGTRLKTAREARGLERKDVAKELRLAEKIIMMMEKDRYAADLPVTFIRGYLRSYGKFLEIPEYEIKKAIEPIKPKAAAQNLAPSSIQAAPVTSSNFFMQFFTYLIVFTLIGLVGMWYTHSQPSTPTLADNQINMEPNSNLANNSPSPQPEIKEAPIAPVIAAAPPTAKSNITHAPEENNIQEAAKPPSDQQHEQDIVASAKNDEPSLDEMAEEEENDAHADENTNTNTE